MIQCLILLLSAVVLAVSTITGYAGVCSDAIESVRARLDARLDAIAGAGRAAPEGAGALMHRQPTPGSIAAAEEKLDELSREKIVSINAAMARARAADAAGDKAACDRALEEAQTAIGP
jgi:hypothetical protein